MLLEKLEDKKTITAKQFDKALDKLNKRYTDVADKLGITNSAVWQWVHTSNNIPKKHRKKVIKTLIKWKEQMEEETEQAQTEQQQYEDTDDGQTIVTKKTRDEQIEEQTEEQSSPPTIGEEYKDKRKSLGMSQHFIASAIGISPSSYSYKEREEGQQFTQQEQQKLDKIFSILNQIRRGYVAKALEGQQEQDEPDNKADIKFVLDMLDAHIKRLSGSDIIEEMTYKYLDRMRKMLL